MNRDLIVLPEAADDLRTAYWWYEEQNLGLGEEFIRSIQACFYSIQKNPEIYRLMLGSYRRALARRFPYAIFYEFTRLRQKGGCIKSLNFSSTLLEKDGSKY